MKSKTRQALLWGVIAALLLALPFAVPTGAITTDAQQRYMENTPADWLEDDYAFLFEESEE